MKEIKFQLNGVTATAQLGSRVEKKALYGYSKYIAEKDGVTLSRGYLDPDGCLLQRAAMANLKLDPEGSPTEDVLTEIDGHEATLVPSSFDREAPLTPLPYSALAGFNVSDVYPLEATTGLEPGLYQTDFNYRKSAIPKEALILVKQDGSWLLSGVRRTPTFVGLSVAYAFFDSDEADDPEDTDMDFGMV
jgi:hypothetical protein